METEENGCVPFLDILIIRKPDGHLDHKVFPKKIHTENYLHANSHHFPAQKISVIKTQATRAFRISGEDHKDNERTHVIKVFTDLGYNKKDI